MLSLTTKQINKYTKICYTGNVYKRLIASSTIKTQWASLAKSSQPRINQSTILPDNIKYTYQRQNNQFILSQEVVKHIIDYDVRYKPNIIFRSM